MSNGRRLIEIAMVAIALAMTSGFANDAGVRDSDMPRPAPTSAVSIDPWLDTSDRQAVVRAHQAEFSMDDPALSWDGDHRGCDAGYSNADHRAATLRRVNYYRAMAGVPTGVIEAPGYSAKAQRAAMMMSATGALTHYPDETFACFTPDGQEAAANSNLYLGRNGPRAIDGYIEDPGAGNVDVGHRTTILHPPTRRMGVGDVAAHDSVASANVLWVFDEHVFDEESDALQPTVREAERFVAWPPRGYIPPSLVHPRWSFTVSGHDLSDADVALYRIRAGAAPVPVTLDVVHRSGTPGHVPLPTIVWEPDLDLVTDPDGGSAPRHDQLYLVVVSGVTAVAGTTDGDSSPSTSAGTVEVHHSAVSPEGSGEPTPPKPGRRSFVYGVRILGDRPGAELTPAEFMGKLASSERG